MRERLEARGANPSKTKDLVARAGGIGMLLFARSQPDMPGKLTAHAFSYEHMEIAAYDLLALIADRAGDRETAHVARSIREQESDMAARLAAGFDRAVEASPSGELPDTSRTRMRSRGRRSSCSRRGRESPASPISPAFLRRRLRAAQASRRAGGRPGDRARGGADRQGRAGRGDPAAVRRGHGGDARGARRRVSEEAPGTGTSCRPSHHQSRSPRSSAAPSRSATRPARPKRSPTRRPTLRPG